MRIAFVGITRKYAELPAGYSNSFDRFHLELPYYYARDGKNDVTIVTPDSSGTTELWTEGSLRRVTEQEYLSSSEKFDVVIHWRKWFEHLHRKDALNLINSQDHSMSHEWEEAVGDAYGEKKLHGILCFPTWHEEHLKYFLLGPNIRVPLISGLTLGVDTDIYTPAEKEPRTLLWASDPGRGLKGAVELAVKLWKRDKRYKMKVLYPDYVKHPVNINHPAIEVHKNLQNGPQLWNMFNTAGILPYTSEFMEPSSRAHRQAQAAGCVVLYPPYRGTPSHLIKDGETGFVRPVEEWADLVMELVESGNDSLVGSGAREYAISENWAVQANRFNETIGKLI